MERCLHSYNRDIALAGSGQPANANHPLNVYKIIEDLSDLDDDDSSDDFHDGAVVPKLVPQQADDPQMCVVTSTDLTIDAQIDRLFSWNSEEYKILNIDVKKLISAGWIPMYDRGYIYWYGSDIDNPQFSYDFVI